MSDAVSPPQALTFRLTVTDDKGASNSTDVQVLIVPSYQPPVAAPEANPASAFSGQQVTLDGTNSQGFVADYQWQQTGGTPVILSSGTGATVAFTAPPVTTQDVLTFRLTVTDGDTPNSNTVSVFVMPTGSSNAPPVAVGDVVSLAVVGDTVTLYGSGSYDPEGSALTYLWQQTSGAPMTLSANNQADVTFTVPDTVTAEQTLIFELTVFDDQMFSGSCFVSLLVEPVGYAGDMPPQLTAGSSPTIVYEGQTITLTSSATDVDGNVPAINWTQYFGTPVESTWTTSGYPSLPGYSWLDHSFTAPPVTNTIDQVLRFQVAVDDGYGQTDAETVAVTIRMMGDVNGDGWVDSLDLTAVQNALGSRPGDEGYDPAMDLDQNGIIDDADVALVLANMGRTLYPD